MAASKWPFERLLYYYALSVYLPGPRKEHTMEVNLCLTYFLPDEREEAFNGQPVLVNRTTGEAFGPADMIKPYGDEHLQPAELVSKKNCQLE